MKKRSFGTHATARICQVTPPTIVRWMEEGNLPFFTTFGGHRKVWDADLAAFLRERNIPIPEELKHSISNQVLIVDDEEPVRRVIRRTLEKMDPEIEVHEAEDGFKAGQKIMQFVPILIILDLNLPGIDGFEVCKMIRADPRLKGAKILAVSGHNVEESRRRCLSAGASDFLAKPFERGELRAKIEKITGWAEEE